MARIVLIGTTTPFLLRTVDNPDGIDASIFETFWREQLLRDFLKWIDDNLVPFVTPDTSPGMRGWIRATALGASLQALHDCHVALTTTDFRAELLAITLPALLLHGGDDATSPIDITAQPTAKRLPRAELVVYEGAPHGIPYTHTERLNRDLLAFLAG